MNKKKLQSRGAEKFDMKSFLLIILLDILFFIVFGFTAVWLLNNVAQDSVFVSNVLQEKTNEMLQSGQAFTRDDVFNLLTSNEEFIRAYGSVFNSVVLSIIAFIVLYIIFQSVSWWIADRKRLRFWSLFYRFSLISIVWFLIFLIILFSFLNGVNNIDSLFIPGVLKVAYTILFAVSVVLLSYFLVICYYFVKEKTLLETVKKAFVVGIARFNSIFWKFLLIGLGKIGLFVLVLAVYSFSYNPLLGIILFALLVIPYIAWAKMMIVRILDSI